MSYEEIVEKSQELDKVLNELAERKAMDKICAEALATVDRLQRNLTKEVEKYYGLS